MIGYLLDTNVVFELLRPSPSRRAQERLASHGHEVATGSVGWHELLYSVQRLPGSRRRTFLSDYLATVVRATVVRLSMPVLPFDAAAAECLAAERARSDTVGLPWTALDSQRLKSDVSAH